MTSSTKMPRAKLNVEALEDRLALSLTTATLSGTTLLASCNGNNSNIEITRSGSTTTIKDTTNNFSKSFTGTVSLAKVTGGAGKDTIINNVSALALEAYGNGNDDYLEGFSQADKLYGGAGNDTLRGYGGDDKLYGDSGRDYLIGGAGMDYFEGGADFDRYLDDFALDGWVLGGYTKTDVIQGEAGTCVINAAMAEAAVHINMSPKVTRSGNTYKVRMIDNGSFVYQNVYFDGSYNDNDTRPGQTRSANGSPTGVNNGEFWTVLYQRAFLQLCGTNTSSENSDNWTSSRYDFHDHQRALYALSGWTTSQRNIGTSESTSTAQSMRDDVLAGRMMTAGGTGHAYSVVDVYKDANGNWKVKLYNPWGVDATHQSMSFQNGTMSNDGEITLDWSVFRANFTRVYTARQ